MSPGSSRRAARARSKRAASRGALLAALVTLAGCGQTGPLALPDAARPIERLDPAARPPDGAAQPSPGSASGTTPPAQREPDTDEASNDARESSNGASR